MIKTTKNDLDALNFPLLMKTKTEGLIVLVSKGYTTEKLGARYEGSIVYSPENSAYSLGVFSDAWDASWLIPYHGTLTLQNK